MAFATHHVGDGHVDIALQLAVIVLGPLDDDEVSGKVDAPGQRGRGNHDLDLEEGIELLHRLPVPLHKPCEERRLTKERHGV